MKKQYLYIFILLSGIVFYNCNKPAPTELIQDPASTDDPLQLEVISSNPNDDYYSNGYDSTGVVDSATNHPNMIYASGIKETIGSVTFEGSLAEAVFFDTDNPIYNGENIIGYKTLTPGIVRFNNHIARLEALRIRIKGSIRDTVIGQKYKLYRGRGNLIDSFQFEYNSSVNFKLAPLLGSAISFNIPTPAEITGKIKIQGSKSEGNLKVVLEWTNASRGQIQIIIGGVSNINGDVFPFYRINTNDDGKFVIPANLISQIPSERFNKIAVTLIRKYERYEKNDSGNKKDIYLLTQSVHTIIINSP
jgi:hypothetical protein